MRLAAGASQEEHQLPRECRRHRVPKILLNQGERQIDAGADSRRGVEFSVFDEDRVPLHLEVSKAAGE